MVDYNTHIVLVGYLLPFFHYTCVIHFWYVFILHPSSFRNLRLNVCFITHYFYTTVWLLSYLAFPSHHHQHHLYGLGLNDLFLFYFTPCSRASDASSAFWCVLKSHFELLSDICITNMISSHACLCCHTTILCKISVLYAVHFVLKFFVVLSVILFIFL